jgi:hypothetical protein
MHGASPGNAGNRLKVRLYLTIVIRIIPRAARFGNE